METPAPTIFILDGVLPIAPLTNEMHRAIRRWKRCRLIRRRDEAPMRRAGPAVEGSSELVAPPGSPCYPDHASSGRWESNPTTVGFQVAPPTKGRSLR